MSAAKSRARVKRNNIHHLITGVGLTPALSCEHSITNGGEAAYRKVLVSFNAR